MSADDLCTWCSGLIHPPDIVRIGSTARVHPECAQFCREWFERLEADKGECSLPGGAK